MSRTQRLANWALALGLPVLLLAWIEGCASGLIALRAALDTVEAPAIRRHDADLGWVSLPNLALPDFWGPGRDLHTNTRGFRGRREVAPELPPGRFRVVCSGDSFAFGEGVGDDATWCHRLSVLDPRVEAVNLGQSGYGVDQAFLRYREQTSDLEVGLHVLSFIGPDLTRAGSDDFHGFAKPVFRLEGDALVLTGVPVPRVLPTVRRFLSGLADELRTVQFVRRGTKKLFGKRRPDPQEIFARLGPTLRRIFAEADALARSRDSETLFVYLPLQSEIHEDGRWRGFVRDSFARSGLPFVDLTEALRALPEDEAQLVFLQTGDAAGHYAERGNAWAAQVLEPLLRSRVDAALARPVP